MEVPSIKKEILKNYKGLPTSEDFKYNKLLLLTASGIICGIPVEIETGEDEPADVVELVEMNQNLLTEYKEKHGVAQDHPLPGDDGFIMLKDATIMNAGVNTKLGSVVVFYDEIIGVSVGLIE